MEEEKPKVKEKFSKAKHLTESEKKDYEFTLKRIEELKQGRKEQYGVDVERIWADADSDYVPHRLKDKGKKVIATDEDRGWRGAVVQLGSNDWQSDVSQPNAFIKIQTALSILVDQNPSGVFTPGMKKYQATTELIKQLYQRSWEIAKSKGQLKLFIFNLAKYGWAIARTYPLRITRKVKCIQKFDDENPEKSIYVEKEVVEYNDIFRENLNPWNAWIDDMAKPNNSFSVRDWAWRKVYAMDAFKEEFGKYKNADYVEAGGVVTEVLNQGKKSQKEFQEKDLVEVYFYENRLKDLYMVIANNVPVIIQPLPISDSQGNKKLSCWQTYWNLRNAECPLGIGIYEAIRNDQMILDRFRNMTIDQITLCIYKMFFYQGTQSLTETGDIKISPGVGKQALDPKNINWLDVPGPGSDAYNGILMIRKDLDEASGITDPLLGNVTGKTAFEIAQAKEAALKKLKVPLENITDALDIEAYISISLIQLLNSVPEVIEITDPVLQDEYLKEVESDPELWERDENNKFYAKVYPEYPLNLEKDDQDNLVETRETQFFRIKPKYLHWEGVINVKSQSILTPSKQVDKALDLEMYNMLIPLLGQDPQLYSKIAKSLVKLYDKDPKDILPPQWLVDPTQAEQELFMPIQDPNMQQGAQPPGGNAQKLVGSTQMPSDQPQGMVQKLISRFIKPSRV